MPKDGPMQKKHKTGTSILVYTQENILSSRCEAGEKKQPTLTTAKGILFPFFPFNASLNNNLRLQNSFEKTIHLYMSHVSHKILK